MEWVKELFESGSGFTRVLLILGAALGAHLLVRLLLLLSRALLATRLVSGARKVSTLLTLATSIAVFGVYFVALGFILKEAFDLSLMAYFASASILGLAIGFGSQGLVQDVVAGITILFADLYHVGEMVEISGQTGIVTRVGLRFTVLRNFNGAEVFIPNRALAHVVVYPRGYVRAFADVRLAEDAATADRMEERVRLFAEALHEQFPGVLITPPSIEGRQKTRTGKTFLRVKFRVWPGQGAPLETSFRREAVDTLRAIDAAYADWMVAFSYEVESKKERPRRRQT